MTKKPTLTVIGSPVTSHEPPASLGQTGGNLWRSIHGDYVVEDAGGHQMLLRICEAADSLASYDEEVNRDGPTIRTKSGVREHPLLRHQLATRSFIVRSLHRLGLDIEPTRNSVGRPPGPIINKAR